MGKIGEAGYNLTTPVAEVISAMKRHQMAADRDGSGSLPLQAESSATGRQSAGAAEPADLPFDPAAALGRTARDRELLQELAAICCHECLPLLASVRAAAQ